MATIPAAVGAHWPSGQKTYPIQFAPLTFALFQVKASENSPPLVQSLQLQLHGLCNRHGRNRLRLYDKKQRKRNVKGI